MAREIIYKNEKDVKAQVKKLLNDHGWFWWMPPMNGYGLTGVSDFNALRGGVFLAVETKFRYNKPTMQQKSFLESITAESAFGFVVNETNIHWLKLWFEAFDRSVEAATKNQKPTDEDGALMLEAIRELTTLIVETQKPARKTS